MTQARALDRALALAAVEAGARRYFADRRARVEPFVDAHFSLRGTLALHRAALGWDIAKAPLNLSLAAPQIVMQLGAKLADRLGAPRMGGALRRSILLPTAVAREVEWLVHTELLELPFRQKRRQSRRDALAETILAEPIVAQALEAALLDIARHGEDPVFRERLSRAMGEYGMSRAAAAEITTGLLSLGAGAVAFNKLTPGAVSLGPTLAGIMAQQAAVASFPLGGWLGGVWYGLFPVAPSLGMLTTTTGGLMLASASLAAFAGVLSDPMQRALGLHRARLLRMIGALERQFFDTATPGFSVHDHYLARMLDVFDLVSGLIRLTRS
ncbi:MAG: hypothetical protein JO264_09275 [Acidisphaera sp.]|nr:hypothetical protein [Acidisphaera sp.]